ncbi:MAG: hypothetical protein JXA69_08555 [Phycisphaerae bacterium]|nr:hypothetical protein [Phycisphaerae bacterium]
MYRTFGIAVTALWLTAMAALFYRDVWPAWTAQEPPNLTAQDKEARYRQSQCGIFDEHRRRVGTGWSEYVGFGQQVQMKKTVVLERVPMLPPICIDTVVTMMADGDIDAFELDVVGVMLPDGTALKISMQGESYGRYIPCTLQIGSFRRTFKLDAAASRLISDSIQPFDVLPDLRVGQSWRMQILDPLAAALYQKTRPTSIIATVERMETIEHQGERVQCFLVTAGRVHAWVAPDGRVLRQEADMPIPGLGKLIVEDEPFDAERRTELRRSVCSASAPTHATTKSTDTKTASERIDTVTVPSN